MTSNVVAARQSTTAREIGARLLMTEVMLLDFTFEFR